MTPKLSKGAALAGLLLSGLAAHAQTVAPSNQPAAPAGALVPGGVRTVAPTFSEVLFPHGLFEAALRDHVGKGGIDYARLKGDAQLAAYVDAVGRADRSKFPVITLPSETPDGPPRLDRGFETAYLINAYNAVLLKTLADAYPINAPDDIKGLRSDKRFLIAGQMMSLQELQDQITARDPRAFFALFTGTRGGPALAPKAYTYNTLDPMLDAAIHAYVDDPRRVEVLRIDNKVTADADLQRADSLFSPLNAAGKKVDRKNWGGVKRLLQNYTSRGSDKRYFINNDFRFTWRKTDTSLNYENTASPATSTSNVTLGSAGDN